MRINIRISSRDLVSLKRKANRAGMPYQTLISSVLHQYVPAQSTFTVNNPVLATADNPPPETLHVLLPADSVAF